jgi:diacylglycerol O-acyltransferase
MSTLQGYTSGSIDRFFLKHRPTTGLILDFEGPVPSPQEFTARILCRAVSLPALNLLMPSGRGQRWHRRESPLDESIHIRHHTAQLGTQDLDAVTTGLLAQPLPGGASPPWVISLLSGYEEGRFRVCYRINHALQDGVGAAHAVLILLSDKESDGPALHRASFPNAKGMLQVLGDLLWSNRSRQLWPELQGISTRRVQWAYQDVPASHLRAEADTHGVSVNDLCLSALAQAFRRWRSENMNGLRPCTNLSALIPISTRLTAERFSPGNRLASHHLLLPCSEERFADALNGVHRQTNAIRASRMRDSARAALAMLTPRLGERVVDRMAAPQGAQIVAGSVSLSGEVACAGARLRAASMTCDPYNGRLSYISFTRTTHVVRCTAIYDEALVHAGTIPSHWKASLSAEG